MKKFLSLFFALALLALCLPLSVNAEVLETDSGILYEIKDGEIAVCGFNGTGAVMNIPEKINGLPVTSVAAQTCRGDSAITEVRIPKNVKVIGEYAFAECPNLTKVVMKGGVTIGRSCFRDCKALLTLKLPSTLETIDDFAFEGCTMLGAVKIPKGLKSIGTDAFMSCEMLRFDLNGNAAAKAHAKKYNIPTSFADTWEFTVIMTLLVSALIIAAIIIGKKMIKNKKRA